MQVMPWSALRPQPDGYEHGFLFQGDRNWLLNAYCKMLRGRWPKARIVVNDDEQGKEWSYCPPKIPRSLPAHGVVFVYRDREMEDFAGDHGRGSDMHGESYITIWIWPTAEGSHIAIVVSEPLPHPFTKWVVGTFLELIGWWYHIRFDEKNDPHCRPPGRTLATRDRLIFVGQGGPVELPKQKVPVRDHTFDVEDAVGTVSRFFDGIRERWPHPIIKMITDEAKPMRVREAPKSLPASCQFFIFRDARMARQTHHAGFGLPAEEEGLLRLFVRRLDGPTFRMNLTTPGTVDEHPFSKWAVETLDEATSPTSTTHRRTRTR